MIDNFKKFIFTYFFKRKYFKVTCPHCNSTYSYPYLVMFIGVNRTIHFIHICPKEYCLKGFKGEVVYYYDLKIPEIFINHNESPLYETFKSVTPNISYNPALPVQAEKLLLILDSVVKEYCHLLKKDNEQVRLISMKYCLSNYVNEFELPLIITEAINKYNYSGGNKMGLFKKGNKGKKVTVIEENDGELVELTIDTIKKEALEFCEYQSNVKVPHLYGSNDGKAVGTYIEHEFKKYIAQKYSFMEGNSARGIDLPGVGIETDIKVTSIRQPQSSCPFKSARQKVYGLGYNLLLFVYKKHDDERTRTSSFEFVSCAFIDKDRTGDFQTTRQINEILNNDGNMDDLFAFFEDKNIPGDEIVHTQLAEEIMANPPQQGYLTISNALQWRLQYKRIVDLPESIEGIDKIV